MAWWAVFAAGTWLAERLPSAVVYLAGRVAALVIVLLPVAPRERLRRNLSRASGEALGSARLAAFVRLAYATQLTNYIDLMRSRRISEAEVAGAMQASGPGWDALLAAVREKEGAVIVTAHFGRMELLNHFLSQYRLPITLPVERLRPTRLFDLICALRSHKGLQLVPHDAGLRACLRALQRGDMVALVADWDPSGQGVPVRFFGATARFPPGPAFLALRSRAPLFVGLALPGEGQGRFRAWVELPLRPDRTDDLDADVQTLTQEIASSLERHIRRGPGKWVMFHDLWAGGVSQSAAAPRSGGAVRTSTR
jgi:KDO2-lipid IV(A) lauroyltransferase